MSKTNSTFAELLSQIKKPDPKVSKITISITKNDIVGSVICNSFQDAHIIIKNRKAYIPSVGKSPGKIAAYIEPIYICQIDLDELEDIISHVLSKKIVTISDKVAAKLVNAKTKNDSPVLKSTNSTSWRNLRNTSVAYSIQTVNEGKNWVLFLHNPKKTGANKLEFPITTPIKKLVEIILEDVKKYSHELNEG